MPKQAVQRFVESETNEISLVDMPANEVPFLVKKNKDSEESNMTAAAQTASDDATTVPVAVDAGNADVAKAMESVNAIVANIHDMVTAKAKAPEGDASASTDDTEEEVDTTKAVTLNGVLEAAGLEGDALATVQDAMKKAGFDPAEQFGKKGDKSKKTEKAAEAEGTEEAVGPEALTMDGLAVAINKAAAFTPARIAQLQSMQETLKLVMEAIAPNGTPKTKVPDANKHPNPNTTRAALVTKSAEGDEQPAIVDALKSLASSVNAINDRVGAIEDVRSDGNGNDGEATETTTTKSKSIWAGTV